MRSGPRLTRLAPVVALVVSLFIPAAAAAQFDTAAVLGTVRDPQGGQVPGVTMTLANVNKIGRAHV